MPQSKWRSGKFFLKTPVFFFPSIGEFIQSPLKFFVIGRLAVPADLIFHKRNTFAFDRSQQNHGRFTLRRVESLNGIHHVFGRAVEMP